MTKEDDDKGLEISLIPLNEHLNEEEKKGLRQELENITEQDLQDFVAESKEELHDLAAAARAAKRAHTDDKDKSTDLLLENELKERGVQLKTELSIFRPRISEGSYQRQPK
jgi:hypothetical protein